MFDDSLPALIAGGLLLALGCGSAWYLWQHREPPPDAEPLARKHAWNQVRRRLQISALVILVGILIPLGDLLPFFRRAPVAFAIYWVGIMCLAGWIALLGLADFVSSQTLNSRAQRRLEQQRAELEAELTRARFRSGSRFHSDE